MYVYMKIEEPKFLLLKYNYAHIRGINNDVQFDISEIWDL